MPEWSLSRRLIVSMGLSRNWFRGVFVWVLTLTWWVLWAPCLLRAEVQSPLIPVNNMGHFDLVGSDLLKGRTELLKGIEHNVRFLSSEAGISAYQRLNYQGVSLQRVQASLARLHEIVVDAKNAQEVNRLVTQEFQLYRSIGNDGAGRVVFTGYFQPRFEASYQRTAAFQYPIFAPPKDLSSWELPHPSRVSLEGYDGRGIAGSPVEGRELAWLKSRYDAFMIHLQGSAQLEFPDGAIYSIGYAAGTKYPFRGIPQSFLDQHQVGWQHLSSFFARRPDLLNEVLSRNNRFIFFRPLKGGQPLGSIGVPVIPERSIATDKNQFPPGAIGLIQAKLPEEQSQGSFVLKPTIRVVLDQDTGSAIRGPGRVDIFMGSGDVARKKANLIYTSGELYYLLLRA